MNSVPGWKSETMLNEYHVPIKFCIWSKFNVSTVCRSFLTIFFPSAYKKLSSPDMNSIRVMGTRLFRVKKGFSHPSPRFFFLFSLNKTWGKGFLGFETISVFLYYSIRTNLLIIPWEKKWNFDWSGNVI